MPDKPLESYINEKRMVELGARMVRIPSVTGEEKAMADFLAAEFKRMGLEVKTMGETPDRPNIIGRLRGSAGKPVLIFNGHIDVVPTGDRALWSFDPWAGIVRNGKLLGRGSCDMKLALAAEMEAVMALLDAGVKLNGDIILECVVDEERGGYKGTKYVTDNGVVGDFCINTDGGDLKIGICSKGDYGVEITTFGKATHASTPEKGVNAVHQMLAIANELRRIPRRCGWSARRHKLVGPPLINVSVMEGGIQRNMVPDKCRMVVDRRTVPGFETMDDARREIAEVIETQKRRDPRLHVEVKEIIDVDAYEIPETGPVVQALVSAATKVMGRKPRFTGCKGFTDGHWLTVNHGIPCATFGGNGGGVHGVDEYADIDSYVKSARVYALAALELVG
jgi:acetylornithine deacetylase/succinyl-diaminopimelate desuccinylase family protein